MKKPPNMATKFQSSIAKTEAIGGTPEVKIMFTDDSGFSFQAVNGDPKPAVNGAAGSLAHEFAADINKYTFLAAGVQMAFNDGSSCNMNFGKVIGALAS
jgi:inosine/xanthosine triphosphate pyrophosphatase family protein